MERNTSKSDSTRPAPDIYSGSTSKRRRSTGTSNAAALTTRAGIFITDAVEEVMAADGEIFLESKARAQILRALITHCSAWGETGTLLDAAFPPAGRYKWQGRRSTISRFLGFGRPDYNRILESRQQRATLLADDTIAPGELHTYRIPVPRSMIKSSEIRRIIVTLAWSTPIHMTSLSYRGVALDIVDANGQRKFWRGVASTPVLQPHADTGRRGTLQHFILEGKNRTVFDDPLGMFIGIQARALHNDYSDETVPYALAVSLEVSANVRDDIKTEVATRIRPRVRQRTRIRT